MAGRHYTLSVSSGIVLLCFRMQRLLIASALAIPPPYKEYSGSTDLYVFWIRDSYKIP